MMNCAMKFTSVTVVRPHQQERGQDRHRSHDQRHHRDEAGEHERQDQQRAEAADDGLREYPVAFGLSGRELQRAETGDPDARARRRGGPHRLGHPRGRLRPEVGAGWQKDQGVRGPPVRGDERPVAGGGVVDHAGAELPRGREGPAELVADARAVDGPAGRQGRHHDVGFDAVVSVVHPRHLLGGLLSRAARLCERLGQPAGGRGDGGAAESGQQHPERHHEQPVTQDERGQSGHASTLGIRPSPVVPPARTSRYPIRGSVFVDGYHDRGTQGSTRPVW
jgi:hypothetical protein